MIETIGIIKALDEDHDTFEIVLDTDDNTVTFFKLNSDEGITFHRTQVIHLINLLKGIQNNAN